MVDLAQFIAASAPSMVGRCLAGTELATLDEEAAETLRAAIDNDRVTHIAIDRVTSRAEWPGSRISESVVRRHRRGECACSR